MGIRAGTKEYRLHIDPETLEGKESNISFFRAFWFTLDPAQTHFLRFIPEGYDNEFQLTTLSKEKALVRVLVMKGSEGAFLRLLLGLKDRIGLSSPGQIQP